MQLVTLSTRGYNVPQLIKIMNAVGKDEWDQQIRRTMQFGQSDAAIDAELMDLFTMVCLINVRPRQQVRNRVPIGIVRRAVRRAERRAAPDLVLPVADFPVWLVFRVFERLPDADLATWMAVNSYHRILAGGILNRRSQGVHRPLSRGVRKRQARV